MGYYTSYNLKWTKPEPAGIPAFTGYQSAALDPDGAIKAYIAANEEMAYSLLPNGDTNESAKWYEHEEDMKRMSKEFPGVVFTLNGEGEEAGDVWRKFFKDGQMAGGKAEITLPKNPWEDK